MTRQPRIRPGRAGEIVSVFFAGAPGRVAPALAALALAGSALVLSGCQPAALDDLMQGRKIDYQADDSQRGRRLEHPPDLISDARESSAEEEESADGVSLSEYRVEDVPEIAGPDAVAPESRSAEVALKGGGNLQWLESELPPEESWEIARAFWTEQMGFPLEHDRPKLGFMETEWLDLRSLRAFGLAGLFDDFLNRVRDSGQRDKFRTRIDPADERTRSRIYVAHRHVTEVYNEREGTRSGVQAMPPDPHLEAEMLRRMLLYFSGEELPSEDEEEGETDGTVADADAEGEGESAADALEDDAATVTVAAEGEEEKPIELGEDYDLRGDSLLIRKPLRDAFLLVRIGLDRGGFTLEDRDVSQASFYIRHTGGPESDKIFGASEEGFFNRLFVRADPVVREIKIQLTAEGGDGSVVRAEAADDEGDLTEEQSEALLRLLAENLP